MKQKLRNQRLGILLVIILLCTACAPKETGESTSNTQATEPATEPVNPPAESMENVPDALRVLNEHEIPFQLTIQTGETTCDVYRIGWNVETGELADKEFCYEIECDNSADFWNIAPDHWTGGSMFLGHVIGKVNQCANGLTYDHLGRETIVNYGKCYYKAEQLWVENADGTTTLVALPDTVPAEVYDRGKLTGEPYYATVDGDMAIVVYMRYQFNSGEDSDFVYCTYPVKQPEAAQWRVAHLPAAYRPDVILATWCGAYADGTLFFTTDYDLLALDIQTGTISYIAGIDDVRPLCPDGTTIDSFGIEDYAMIAASQNGVIIVHFSMNDTDGTPHSFFMAANGNGVLGVAEITHHIFTFYDRELNVLGTDDTYADTGWVYIKWAKDD